MTESGALVAASEAKPNVVEDADRKDRLKWLANLRWWAMSGTIVAAIMAAALDWNFVVPEGIAAGVALGVVVNFVLVIRARRERPVGPSELSLHSVADAMALTWLLAFSGGLANPISAMYSFHVVLGALLAGRVGAVVAGTASAFGVALLFGLEALGLLPSAPLHDIPAFLRVGALFILLAGLSYFALVLAARLREGRQVVQAERDRAQQSLALFFDSLDALQVGIEVPRADEGPLRNRFAEILVEKIGEETVRTEGRTTFVDNNGDSRIVECMKLMGEPEAQGGLAGAMLWVDRTDQLVVEQRHIMLERLATLGRALQGVAHELNTPLMTMQTLARDLLAALEDAPLSAEQRADISESTEIIVDEARRCRSLTQGLLATAHPDGAGLAGQTAAAVATRAIRLVGDGGKRVEVDIESLSAVLHSEADRVLQILMNLVQNALLATPTSVKTPVFVRGVVDGEHLVLTVEDRGEGIPASVRERLFEPFVTTRMSGEGTGLGLYTSLRIARDLGGDLTLEDGPMGGTIARLTLPLQAPSPVR